MLKTALAASVALALAGVLPAKAQAPAAPDMKTFASSADVQAMIVNIRKVHKAEPTLSQPILALAPYRAMLEYRTAVGPAAVHEKEAEFFYVIEGSGVLVTGGKLREEKRQNAANLGGTGIDGGESRTVAKGDFIVVPEGTPHWYSDIKGELILMSLHVPRG
jgi:mannose-6-phosphate isomerase-like protein (cupin superfamily)